MKKLLKNLLVTGALGMLVLTSCKKNDTEVKATSGKAGTLTATSTSLTLSKADSTATPVVTFTFSNANYGYKGQVLTNTLQIDTVGDNWAKPAVTLSFATGVTTQSYTTAQLNTMALNQLKIVAGKTGNFNVRVVQTIGASPVYSNVVALSITPYSIVIPETFLYVVGAYQGWTLTSRDSLASKDGKIYTGIINFTAGNNQFLILPDATDYNNKYATTQTSTPTSTVAQNAPNNLVAPTAAGNYIVTFNLSAGTITFSLSDYYSLIGNDFAGQNWDTDNAMKYVNGTGQWVATIPMVATSGGGFKIRQDDAWTNSWGTSGTDGVLTDASGGNLSISASGTYYITFTMAPSVLNSTPVTLAPWSITAK